MKFSLALDSSQIVEYLLCPDLWRFKYGMNLTHKYIPTTAMDKGTIVHGLLERYYEAIIKGKSWIEAQQISINHFRAAKKFLGIDKETLEFLVGRFMEYTVFYMDKDFIPRKTESGFSIPLLDTSEFLFVLEGRIDFIGQFRNGQSMIMDFKTQEKEASYHPKSIQFKNYVLATGIRDLVIGYIRLHKKLSESTFERQLCHFSEAEIQDWKKQVIEIFFKVAHSVLINDFDHFGRIATCQNSGWGRPCMFTEVCGEKDPRIRNGLININFMQRPEWKPWEMGEKR